MRNIFQPPVHSEFYHLCPSWWVNSPGSSHHRQRNGQADAQTGPHEGGSLCEEPASKDGDKIFSHISSTHDDKVTLCFFRSGTIKTELQAPEMGMFPISGVWRPLPRWWCIIIIINIGCIIIIINIVRRNCFTNPTFTQTEELQPSEKNALETSLQHWKMLHRKAICVY